MYGFGVVAALLLLGGVIVWNWDDLLEYVAEGADLDTSDLAMLVFFATAGVAVLSALWPVVLFVFGVLWVKRRLGTTSSTLRK